MDGVRLRERGKRDVSGGRATRPGVPFCADCGTELPLPCASCGIAVVDYDEALMYARRGGPGDAETARPLLEQARAQFESIGMSGWIRRADELAAHLKATDAGG